MNWKEKIKKLLDKRNIKENTIHHTYEYLYKAIPDLMIEFAKLACEKQKEICANLAEADVEIISDELHGAVDTRGCWTEGEDYEVAIIRTTILEAPTVNFEEDD